MCTCTPYVHVCLCACMLVCVCMLVCACMLVCLCACVLVCLCACVLVCMYAYVYGVCCVGSGLAIAVRILVNVVVLTLLAGSGYVVYYFVRRDQERTEFNSNRFLALVEQFEVSLR